MTELDWFYIKDGNRAGPISADELRKLFESGELGRATLVWTAGHSEWRPASEIEALRDAVGLAPPPLPVSEGKDVPQIRPWIRYWARLVDLTSVSVAIGFFIEIVFPDLFEDREGMRPDMLFSMGLLFAWVFIESGLLSSWGTTPGKWLLNVRLKRKEAGPRLAFSDVLQRSFMVWWRGLGIGFPIVALVTQIVAYRTLTSEGITSWDRDAGFEVSHGRVGPGRAIMAIGWFFVFLWIVVLGESAQRGW